MPNPLSQIQQAVHKACPELLELSFGCKIKYHDDFPMRFIVHENDDNNSIGLYEKNNTVQGIEDIKEFEILGHPIQLQHVLRAMEANVQSVTIECDGNWKLYESLDMWVAQRIKYNWDLTKDLNGQSPETLEFIASLLK